MVVADAPAEVARKGFLYLILAWMRIFIEKGFCGQDHAGRAEAALKGGVIDKGLLEWVRTLLSSGLLVLRSW